MKKKLLVFVSFIVFLSFLKNGITATAAQFDEEYFKFIMEMQKDAVYANDILMSSFDRNEETLIYPGDFGGDYIDEDFKLHILVTEAEAVKKYSDILEKYSNTIRFDVVDYSFNELMLFAEEIASELPNEACVKCGVDVKHNVAEVGIYDIYKSYMIEKYSLEISDKTGEYVYDDRVVFNMNYSVAAEESSYLAGSPITITSGGTLGGSGTYSSATALVTAGHCSSSTGDSAYISGTNVGTVAVRQNVNNGYGDYAIISAASGVQTNRGIIAGGGNVVTISGFINNPPVGMYVNKYGKTSGCAYCEITGTMLNVSLSGVTIKGMTEAKVISGSSANGDSGGPYWSGTDFCGVHGGSAMISSVRYTYFTPNYYLYNRGFVVSYY